LGKGGGSKRGEHILKNVNHKGGKTTGCPSLKGRFHPKEKSADPITHEKRKNGGNERREEKPERQKTM